MSPKLDQIGLSLAGLVLGARFFVASEGAVQGQTLWLAALAACSALPGWLGAALDRDQTSRLRHGWWLALLVLAGASVVIPTTMMLAGILPGNVRLAVNVCCETLGVLAWAAGLQSGLKRLSARPGASLGELTSGVVALAWIVATFGLWQHYFELPRMAAELEPAFEAARRGDPIPRALQETLTSIGISLDADSIRSFEARVLFSREPFAFFALANTLGGVLAVAICFAGANARRVPWWLGGAGVGLMLWCLVLTKSRTAVLALVVAVGVGLLLGVGERWWMRWRWRSWPTVALLGVVVGLVLLIRGGSLDRQIVTEAGKSLGYRWEYWQATLAMLGDGHLLWGIGPGQFQSVYVRYKLPGASEEVADPHNFLLEAGATGGALGLLAAGSWIALTFLSLWRASRANAAPAVHSTNAGATSSAVAFPAGRARQHVAGASNAVTQDTDGSGPFGAWWIGVVSSPWVVLAYSVATGAGWDDRLLVAGGLLIAMAVIARAVATPKPALTTPAGTGLPLACSCGALALLLHLCASGGYSLPILQHLWLLAVLLPILGSDFLPARQVASSDGSTIPAGPRSTTQWEALTRWVVVALGVVLTLTIAWECSRTQAAANFLAQADAALYRGQLDRAIALYRQAADSDPLSPVPHDRLAEALALPLIGARPEVARPRGAELKAAWERVFVEFEAAAAREPVNHARDWRRGTLASLRRLAGEADQGTAVQRFFEQARAAYPTNSRLLADWSDQAGELGDQATAQQAAARALELDDLNAGRGHTDRLLPTETRARLMTRARTAATP